jgi:hypothetical protein
MESTIQYVQKLKDRLSRVSLEYGIGNTTGAEDIAIAAHRDYFGHLKVELEKRNATELSEQTDRMLRVELVELIANKSDQGSIDAKLAEINEKLDEAIVIVPEFPLAGMVMLASAIGALTLLARAKSFARYWMQS